MTGENMKQLITEDYKFPCPPEVYETDNILYEPLMVFTTIVGILLLVSATMLCAFVLYLKTKVSYISIILCVCVLSLVDDIQR